VDRLDLVSYRHNLWKAPGFPHRGWESIGVVDLNPPDDPSDDVTYATCEACGQTPIRFVHTLVHDDWDDPVSVGCKCCERLTDDYVTPRRHEAELKRQAAARARWVKQRWRTSAKGSLWVKVRGVVVTVFRSRFGEGYLYGIGRDFSRETFADLDSAKSASYDGFTRRNRPK
jgi:hypothetical protein